MTKAEIWNEAFGLLVADVEIGDPDTDTGMAADLARRTYGTIYHALLESYDWTFGIVDTSDLATIVGATTSDGYAVYALPSDCLSPRKVQNDSGTGLTFRVVNGGLVILDAVDTVNLVYVRDPGEAQLPAYFVKALTRCLAAEWAMPITGSESLAAYWENKSLAATTQARSIDWQRQGQEAIIDESQLTILSERAG